MSVMRSPATTVALLLAAALGLALVLPAPSSDTRELLSWGLTPGLTTPKQPPLMQWMGFLVMRLAWPTTFWCVLLQQALNAGGLAYVYRTLRLWRDPEAAGLATAWLAGAVCFVAAPVPFALNADILQFPFWAAMLFHALRAFETRASAHFGALALAFALAFYAKYTVALFALALAAASFAVPAYRGVWRDGRFYLAGLAAAALVAPHLWAARGAGAVGHATGTLYFDAPLEFRLRNLWEMALGFAAYLAPAWVWLGLALWRGEARWALNPAPAAVFARAATGASLALLAFLVLGFGFKYPSRYDAPFLFAIWLALQSGSELRAARPWMARAALGFAGVVCAGGVMIYGLFTAHPRQQEPLAAAAQRLRTEWRARYACGPAYVMGDFWSAYGLGISWRPSIPGAHLTEMDNLPGYDPARRAREGAIVVYRDRLDAKEIGAVFPGLDLSGAQQLTLPLMRTWSGATITYAYVFVPPGGC